MVEIWRYVLATDNGIAPCIDNDVLSLCCCKPVIRRCARVGDYVMGFMPIGFNRETPQLAWAGIISKKITMGDYQAIYPDRQDAIYKRDSYHSDGRENLSHNGGGQHADQENQTRDKNGIYALLFDQFWYWGGKPFPVPENLRSLAYYFAGQKKSVINKSIPHALRQWLESLPTGIHGQPRDLQLLTTIQSCDQGACSIKPPRRPKNRRNPTTHC